MNRRQFHCLMELSSSGRRSILPPAPPPLDHSNTSHDAELEHIRLLKRQQLEEAIKAKTSVNVIAPKVQLAPPIHRQAPVPVVHLHASEHALR
ncbi:MAG: hypothetical protein MRK00_00135 [Nitrosomonas sp.]|nr:hypothetical protein [Nitrosomonas sp.]